MEAQKSKHIRSLKFKNPKNATLALLLLAVIGVFSVAMPTKFFSPLNFSSMVSQFPEFGLLAIAMMLAMIVGGIDLSVVAISNFTGVVAALILSHSVKAGNANPSTAIMLAIAAVLVLSVVCGAINGTLIALAGVPAILATLGTQALFLGLAIVITKGHSISGFPDEFMFLGNGALLGLPMPFLIFIILALLADFLLRRTRQGFNMYMVGANPIVARFSGVNNASVLVKTYVMSGLMAGLASLIMISRVNSMRPGYGSAYLLQAILVAVLGGIDPKGGYGNVFGLIMGIFILQATQSGLNILSFSPFFKKFMWGLALLMIMVINYLSARYSEKRRIRSMRDAVPVQKQA